jgi:carboxypeptidase T
MSVWIGRNSMKQIHIAIAALALAGSNAIAQSNFDTFLQADAERLEPTHYIEVEAKNRATRTKVADLGYSIDEVRSDTVYFPGTMADVQKLRAEKLNAKAYPFRKEWLQDEVGMFGERFISTDATYQAIEALQRDFPKLASVSTFGKSFEGKDLKVVRISGQTLADAAANKLPVVFYTGCHHAREHLSVEIPLRFARYMLENYGKNPDVTRLLDTRELYVAPLINPDGHKYDYIDGLRGRMWRKNRRTNSNGTYGVDLNRNYGYQWGTGGSSTTPSSDVYMGTQPFSEPETASIKAFVDSQPRMKTLLTFHTFSELVLYPWGHTYDKIGQGRGFAEDLPIFEKMAKDMAQWNHYTPEQASDLYIASGDTTDWAYGEHRIFAFTFELSPNSMMGGGFYPNPSVIEPTFASNLKPMLYMMEYADNPGRVLHEARPDFDVTPSEMGLGIASFQDLQL